MCLQFCLDDSTCTIKLDVEAFLGIWLMTTLFG